MSTMDSFHAAPRLCWNCKKLLVLAGVLWMTHTEPAFRWTGFPLAIKSLSSGPITKYVHTGSFPPPIEIVFLYQ